MILFDFSEARTGPPTIESWQAVDDRVMGGVSVSRLRAGDGHAVFEGTVSGRNNGGFASVRAPVRPPMDAPHESLPETGWQHLQLRVRGAPATYFVNLRTDDARDGISYRTDFTPTPDWTTLELPFADFAATFRGRPVPDAPTLEPNAVRQVGLMIAERQYGAFRLDILAISMTG